MVSGTLYAVRMALSGESKVSLREHVSLPPQGTAPPSPLAAVKQSPKILGYCLALASGILLFGYDLVIVGNVSAMPEFQ